jgi:hypothetical protein
LPPSKNRILSISFAGLEVVEGWSVIHQLGRIWYFAANFRHEVRIDVEQGTLMTRVFDATKCGEPSRRGGKALAQLRGDSRRIRQLEKRLSEAATN